MVSISKSVLCPVIAAAMLSPAAAFAAGSGTADYDPINYAVSDEDAASYRTVLIKDEEETPVYIDQTDKDGFGQAAAFYLQKSPAKGKYTISYGGGEAENITKEFYISVDPVNDETKMDALEETAVNDDGTVNVGFTATVLAGMQYKSVILESGGSALCYDTDFFKGLTGVGEVMVGVQIDNVPEKVYEQDITVYLSTKTADEYAAADDTSGGAEQ